MSSRSCRKLPMTTTTTTTTAAHGIPFHSNSIREAIPRKRVRFSSPLLLDDNVDDSMFPFPAALEIATAAELWYSSDEMAAFEFEARQLSILVYRSLLKQHDEQTPSLALGPHTRGLETTGCLQRQLLRCRTRAYIQHFQKGHTAEELATVSRELNVWAKHLAFEEAARDFDRAYNNEDESKKIMPKNKKKRKRVVVSAKDVCS